MPRSGAGYGIPLSWRKRVIAWDRLPKSAQAIPAIAARYLQVDPLTAMADYSEYLVIGFTSDHLVKVNLNKALCDCTAASFSNMCKHSLAALNCHNTRKVIMSNTVPRIIGKRPESNYIARQVVLVDDGFYAGFFSRYSEPKLFPKFEGTGFEEKVYLNFLVTHGINERVLPRFTNAGAFIALKHFYDNKSGMESKFFSFQHSLLSKQGTKQELWDTPDEDRLGLDELIGRPAILQIGRSTRQNKDGMWNLNIKSFQAVGPTMAEALRETYKLLTVERNDKGLRNITSPEAQYEVSDESRSPLNDYHENVGQDDYSDHEIPF